MAEEKEKKEEKKEEEVKRSPEQSEGKEATEIPGVEQTKEAMGMIQGMIGKIGDLIGGIFGGGKKKEEKK